MKWKIGLLISFFTITNNSVAQDLLNNQEVKTGLKNIEAWGTFEFNFNHPGARSLGMGGAFIGLADDATAAITNPAGLTQVESKEASFELKVSAYDNEMAFGGNTLEEGKNAQFNKRDHDETLTSVSFVNFSLPTDVATFSAYYRQPFNYEARIKSQQTFYPGRNIADSGGFLSPLPFINPVHSFLRLESHAAGFAAARKFGETGRLRLGFNIEYSHADIDHKDIRYRNFNADFDNSDVSSGDIAQLTRSNSDDGDVAGGIGLLFDVTEKLSIGATYRHGASYRFTEKISGRGSLGTFGVGEGNTITRKLHLNTPDIYGYGLAYRLTDFFTISADVRHITYSDMLNNFEAEGFSRQIRGAYDLDDETEFHIGGEYIYFWKETPIAFRLGYFHEPGHRIELNTEKAERILRQQGINEADFFQAEGLRFPGAEDRDVITTGLGVTFKGGFQVDIAGSFVDDKQEGVFSFVKRF